MRRIRRENGLTPADRPARRSGQSIGGGRVPPIHCVVGFPPPHPAIYPSRFRMPTYQYRCRDCTTEFEIRQSFSDDPITVCPTDGCPGLLRKVFSGVGISFKGDGFYKNDHGSSAAKRRSEVSTASSGGSDASTSGGSDTSGTSGDKGGGADKASTSNGSGGGADNKPAPTKAPTTSGT